MSTDFGVPPIAMENRALVEQRLKELHEGRGVAETLTVEWRGKPLHVEVIDMPTARLFYNPGTHRIRAQRSHDPARDEALEQNAWSEESQDYLYFLLKAPPAEPTKTDPAFEDLRESLRNFKQLEPGLITRDGILVNGNTRHAALRDLPVDSMRVGVLPSSCAWPDIHSVELSLQLRPDQRRVYSYINHLLALDEQLGLGRKLPEISQNFHTTTRACERDIWILAQLRDLITRSKAGSSVLRLMDFENSKEKLFELHRGYTKEYTKNKEKADLLREARLAAIILDFAKTDVRYIEPDFHSRFLDRLLPESVKPAEVAAPAAVTIPGLNRTVQAAGAKVAAARALTDSLLQAKAVQVAGEKVSPAELATASQAVSAIKDAFDEAIEFAGKDFRLRKKRQAAPDRVTDACKDLEQCITDLVMARGSGSLDEGAFDDAVIQLRAVMGRLAIEAQKSIDLPGDGLSWMLDAALEKR